VASLGVKPKEITWQAGVVTCFLSAARRTARMSVTSWYFSIAICRRVRITAANRRPALLEDALSFRAWVGLLQDGAWLRNAARANALARPAARCVAGNCRSENPLPTQANAVFADLPPYVIHALRQAGWKFYTFIGQGGCRLMCAWTRRKATWTCSCRI